ncbi:MAG TPA: hypothetical protein VLA61_21420 [Ideonella sp.]|uniref:hypothetical protein n=1 Tax=Ideonella sp. TaxID=1929293 RepID=UPI002D07E3C0|nr:hypothetical protein [Ideonella sp.]HSI50835.1 hypothetical protein [Ideonella sp.]
MYGVAAGLVALLVAACGGGGDGGSEESAKVSVTFATPQLNAQALAGYETEFTLHGKLTYTGHDTLYLRLTDHKDLISSGTLQAAGESLTAVLKTRPTLTAGTYDSDLQLDACHDEACTQPVDGGPFIYPLHLVVAPNLEAQATVTLHRTGGEAAPVRSLALNPDPAAGELALELTGANPELFSVALAAGVLEIRTLQLPAGSYHVTATVSSIRDARYRTAIDVTYVVDPPEGGEKRMAVEPGSVRGMLAMGDRQVYRFHLQRPTWTDGVPVLTPSADGLIQGLHAVGNDDYEFTMDTAGLLPLTIYQASITVKLDAPQVTPIDIPVSLVIWRPS